MWRVFVLALAFTTSALGGSSNEFQPTVTAEGVPTDELTNTSTYGFDVDYENNEFLLDGKPFRYVSGSFHYFRTPKVYWRDRLRKMRAAGLNAISTYVEWSLHQPDPFTWRWSGEEDLVEFIRIAQEEDLFVLLRPGPYICAERNLGGLPPWLMTLVPDIKMRTNDDRYMQYVEVYLDEVLTRMIPYLRGNGGPIIMVQVENEYGSFHACDVEYRTRLYTIFKRHVGTKALLYTTDGSTAGAIRCGFIPGTYTTIDFGTGANVTKNFEIMRQFQPGGPFVNSEFYPGWLTHWEEPFQRVGTKSVTKTLDEMLALGASVNIYMFYGGTNFGFTSGANGPVDYSPQLTSYDYDAPLTEAGDPTNKYFEIRNVIGKYLPLTNLSLPTVSPKGNYGPVTLKSVIRLFDPMARALFGSNERSYSTTPKFEELGIAHLLVLYETELPVSKQDPSVLFARTHDRALVYVDDKLTAIFSRIHNIFETPLPNPYSKRLQLLVENQGHLNFGNVVEDYKGVLEATLNDVNLRNSSSWNVTSFKLDTVGLLQPIQNNTFYESGHLQGGPVFYRGRFNVSGTPLDTYLDTSGWGKGIAYVNGHNLGRYWPVVGPQITLYVPASWLKTGINELVILELEYAPTISKMTFTGTPNLGRSQIRNWNPIP